MLNINSTEVSSLSQFIHQLETRVLDRNRITLFRGQNTDKALIPNIARQRFKKRRDIIEKRMLLEFNIQSIPYLSYHPKNELEQLTIAQHHGVPTRLLDWTENALAALYFAVSKSSILGENSVIWVLSLESDSDLLINDPQFEVFKQDNLKFFKPSSIIQRVTSQHGWFSLHPFKGGGYYQRADIETNEYRLSKLLIKEGSSKKILQTLETCGINSHTIFRDLDSLGKYIFEKYKS